ncbi:hypothetical protein PYCC9005_004927 [Savitreella phatthalungensis]
MSEQRHASMSWQAGSSNAQGSRPFTPNVAADSASAQASDSAIHLSATTKQRTSLLKQHSPLQKGESSAQLRESAPSSAPADAQRRPFYRSAMSAAASELPLGNRQSRRKVAPRLPPVGDINPFQDGLESLIRKMGRVSYEDIPGLSRLKPSVFKPPADDSRLLYPVTQIGEGIKNKNYVAQIQHFNGWKPVLAVDKCRAAQYDAEGRAAIYLTVRLINPVPLIMPDNLLAHGGLVHIRASRGVKSASSPYGLHWYDDPVSCRYDPRVVESYNSPVAITKDYRVEACPDSVDGLPMTAKVFERKDVAYLPREFLNPTDPMRFELEDAPQPSWELQIPLGKLKEDGQTIRKMMFDYIKVDITPIIFRSAASKHEILQLETFGEQAVGCMFGFYDVPWESDVVRCALTHPTILAALDQNGADNALSFSTVYTADQLRGINAIYHRTLGEGEDSLGLGLSDFVPWDPYFELDTKGPRRSSSFVTAEEEEGVSSGYDWTDDEEEDDE